MAADLRLALVGRAVVGESRVGELRVLHDVRPKLHLVGKQYSITKIEDAEIALFPAHPRMLLKAKAFQLNFDNQAQLGKGRLRLRGGTFTIQLPVIASMGDPKLRLVGKPFTLGLSTTIQFGKPVLRLRAHAPRRVGVAGLAPTVPVTIILTPSPAQAGVLTPTAAQEGLLVPTREVAV